MRELSEQFSCSTAHVYRLQDSGKLEFMRKIAGDGKVNPRVMKIYHNVWGRCNDPRTNRYERYGGRGIKCLLTVQELELLWERDKADELKIPSIDRIDNNGNYTFDNCKFIEFRQNILNSWGGNPVPLYKATKKLKEYFSIFNQAALEKRLGIAKGTLKYLYSDMGCKKEKADKIIEFIENFPVDIFKLKKEDMFELTGYKKQRKSN